MKERKDATEFTASFNRNFLKRENIDMSNETDWADSQRGFIAKMETQLIDGKNGESVWDLNQYAFLEKEDSPLTVNPSLWRQARLNMINGLFEVTGGIYQVRGHDLSVISFIRTNSGWIVIDPLISSETAAASLELLYKHVEKRPVIAVIYTHSHVDHWGGVRGVISEKDVKKGNVSVIAPEGFFEAAISENLMAGNAMSRRAAYMYGNLLPKDAKGQVDAGLGKTTSSGSIGIIEPNVTVKETGQELTIDGIRIIFQLTPDTEAPSEMNFFFPQFRALCMAENCTHNLHNLYTLRGAAVRDAKAWAYYLDEAIRLFGENTDVVFASHHWPKWNREKCVEFMKKQRDMYKYLHDQTLRLANLGYTMSEIAEMVKLPNELAKEWYNRGYYGTVSHDVRAVYQKYLGFFDGNPANLNPLPPEKAALKYVDFMGGAKAVIEKARASFEEGDYRWTAQVVNHLVFAEPENEEARELQAASLEQLGYQSESGPWRNFYLTGALELRAGNAVPMKTASIESDDVRNALGLNDLFSFLGTLVNPDKASGKKITLNFVFTDIGKTHAITLENCVLNNSEKEVDGCDAVVKTTRSAFDRLLKGGDEAVKVVTSGEIAIEGNGALLGELLSVFEKPDFWFNIVMP